MRKPIPRTLLRILTEVSASLDLDRALSRTLALLNEAVGGEQGTIMLLQAEDNLLHYRAGYGYLSGKEPSDGRGFTLKVGEGLAGWVVETREAAWWKICIKMNVGSEPGSTIERASQFDRCSLVGG